MTARSFLLAAAAALLIAGPARADAPPPPAAASPAAGNVADGAAGALPPELQGIDLVDHTGTTIPLDLTFNDETGKPVRLDGFFHQGKPVVLQLVYFECPMLCTLVLNGYVEGAKPLDWRPGADYEVVTVSFDPRDTPKVASAKKANYVAELGGATTAAGWHFLTGDSTEVRKLADAVGFGYRWLPDRGQFAHAAGIFVLTPEGKVSRTLYGIEFPSRQLRLALVEAGEGRLGTTVDKVLLYCFHYDPTTHKYSMVAVNVMKLGGLVILLAVGGLLGGFWIWERRRRRGTEHRGVDGVHHGPVAGTRT